MRHSSNHEGTRRQIAASKWNHPCRVSQLIVCESTGLFPGPLWHKGDRFVVWCLRAHSDLSALGGVPELGFSPCHTSNCSSLGEKINDTINLSATEMNPLRSSQESWSPFHLGSALGKDSDWPFVLHPSIWPPTARVFQRRFSTRDSAISKARQTTSLSIKEVTQSVIFLGGPPPSKSCYYNAKLDVGFSKVSQVISCPIPTGLPRELDPNCLWLFWKTPSIMETHRMAQQKPHHHQKPVLSWAVWVLL